MSDLSFVNRCLIFDLRFLWINVCNSSSFFTFRFLFLHKEYKESLYTSVSCLKKCVVFSLFLFFPSLFFYLWFCLFCNTVTFRMCLNRFFIRTINKFQLVFIWLSDSLLWFLRCILRCSVCLNSCRTSTFFKFIALASYLFRLCIVETHFRSYIL